MIFALSQDLTMHTRYAECIAKEYRNAPENDVEWRCNMCPFSTDLQSEFIFHEALHAGPIQPNETEAGSSNTLPSYRCPLCKKCFSKTSLRNHIRSHTGERPFPCSKCSFSFSKRTDLNIHRKICEGFSSSELQKDFGRRREFVCAECSNAFFTK